MFGFGKRKTPEIPQPPIDSDGKRRVFGEAIFAGEHGNMLRKLGFGLDDEANVIPDQEEYNRRVQASFDGQAARRAALEADLLARHGHNAIRPFFILGDAVINSDTGWWLIRIGLLPYDEWNVVYLPTDRATQAVMGDVPLHPLQAIGPIDQQMLLQIGDYRTAFETARTKVNAAVAASSFADAQVLMEQFTDYTNRLPDQILAHVARVRPLVIALIADVQAKATH